MLMELLKRAMKINGWKMKMCHLKTVRCRMTIFSRVTGNEIIECTKYTDLPFMRLKSKWNYTYNIYIRIIYYMY